MIIGKIDSSDLAKYGISANVLDGLTGGSGSSVENVIENADIPESLQETMIKSADIPEVFKNLLLKNNNKEMYDELGVTTFPQYIGAYVARLVINIIAFIHYIYSGDGNYKSGCVCPGYCIRTTGNRFL